MIRKEKLVDYRRSKNPRCFSRGILQFSEIPQVVVGLYEAMNYAVDSIVLWRKMADLADEHEIWGKEEV